MRTHCYYLAYRRRRNSGSIVWQHPTGGLVMRAEQFIEGKPYVDMRLASEILRMRYHCSPYEVLVVAEVFEREDRLTARRLHRKWEREMAAFVELMEQS